MSQGNRLRKRHLLVGTVLAAAGAASPAQAAPSISNYSITGPATFWVEPKPAEEGAAWTGCLATEPTVSFTVAGVGSSRASLRLVPLATQRTGLQLPLTEFGRLLNDTNFPIGDGPREFRGVDALGLAENRGNPGVLYATQLAAKGKISFVAVLQYSQKWGGVTLPAIKALPTKSVSFTKVSKPAGSCAGITSFNVA